MYCVQDCFVTLPRGSNVTSSYKTFSYTVVENAYESPKKWHETHGDAVKHRLEARSEILF